MLVIEGDVQLSDGRTLHYYDTNPLHRTTAPDAIPVVWHHGTPNVGAPPRPLFAAAEARGLRWVSYDRPGYGGSTPNPGRDVASASGDVAAVADALGLDTFAVFGHSGGGPHALACAALLPERVLAAVSVSGMAPIDAQGLDWFEGFAAAGVTELRAAVEGPEALQTVLATNEFDPEQFTARDHAALAGPWSWLGEVVGQAVAGGLGAMVDDDLAYVRPWGFDPARITAPLLLVHGEEDRMVPSAHGVWLAARCPTAEVRLHPQDGHVSVLREADAALDWLVERLPNPRG